MSTPKNTTNRLRKLQLESLEDRYALAGDLTAVLANGVLTITGDDSANIAALTSDASGQITLTGTDTTINGGTDPVSFTGVNSVNVRLRGGDDELTVVNGSGATPSIAALTPVDIVRHLHISGGDGLDRITVSANVAGGLGIDGGAGNDVIDVADSSAGRSVGVYGGSGDDTITVSNTTVDHSFCVEGGTGNDTITVDTVTGAKEGGISGWSGDDSISVLNSSFRNLGIAGWSGIDTITLEGITARNVGVEAGTGDDTVSMTDVVVTDTLFAHLGDGNDSLSVNTSSARLAWFLGWRGTNTLVNDASNTFTRTRIYGF